MEFRCLRAATYFSHGGKVGKTPPGTAPMSTTVLIVAFPRTPFYGGHGSDEHYRAHSRLSPDPILRGAN